MPAEIRAAQLSDAEEIARLFTTLGHPAAAREIAARWAPWSAEGNSALVAAGSGATLMGVATLHRMVVLHRARPVGRITALVVDPAARGRGIGRALVTAAEAALARAGCGLLEITSHMRHAEAHTFYDHIGYERASLRFARVLAPAGSPNP